MSPACLVNAIRRPPYRDWASSWAFANWCSVNWEYRLNR